MNYKKYLIIALCFIASLFGYNLVSMEEDQAPVEPVEVEVVEEEVSEENIVTEDPIVEPPVVEEVEVEEEAPEEVDEEAVLEEEETLIEKAVDELSSILKENEK